MVYTVCKLQGMFISRNEKSLLGSESTLYQRTKGILQPFLLGCCVDDHQGDVIRYVKKESPSNKVLQCTFLCNRCYSLLNSWLDPTVSSEALPFIYSVCCYEQNLLTNCFTHNSVTKSIFFLHRSGPGIEPMTRRITAL